jgi:hypothetical protein
MGKAVKYTQNLSKKEGRKKPLRKTRLRRKDNAWEYGVYLSAAL